MIKITRSYDFIALDCELANEDYSSICQIGMAFVKEGHIVGTKGIYIDPETFFTNTWLHGIDEDSVAGCKIFPMVLPELIATIQDEILVTHTSSDIIYLKRACIRYGLELPEIRHVDSAKMARRADQRFIHRGYSLENLCLNYDIPYAYAEAHDGVVDAVLAAKVVLYLLKNHPGSLEEWEASLKKPLRRSGSSGRVRQDGQPGGPLEGLSFVFTGTLERPRKEIAAITADLGGNVRYTVNDQIDYLVVGLPSYAHMKDQKPSRKEATARKLLEAGGKIQIITEEEFNSILSDL